MDLLPAFLRITDQECLVVGGGEVAARKAGLLLRAGARVTVVAPEFGAALGALQATGRVDHRARAFDEHDLDGVHLVVAATGDEAVNRRVSAAAVRRRLPVNVVDAPALCTFVFPSIVDRSPLLVAVSTGGASPVLARLLRARLEALIPANYSRLAGLMARFRDAVKARFASGTGRRRFWEEVLGGPVSEMVIAGREDEAAAWVERALRAADDTVLRRGEVYLIGAGPGDPDLLTFRALRLLQQADVLLYDRLVAPRILEMARRDAERIYVGKRRSYHSVRQEEINETLVALARQGKKVARLKGGDPFVFGRGGEEIATLAAEGVPFQIVPGITAANGCAAYAGIPLTHRDHAHSVVFVTGHLKDGTVNLDWRSLVQPRQTVVVYMGLTGLEIICRELVRHGMAGAMPAALIEQGTTENQRVIAGTLDTLPGIVARAPAHAPTLLIVGEVVRLRETLAWYGGAPRVDP